MEDVQKRFLYAYNNFFVDTDKTIEDIELAKRLVTNTDEIDNKILERNKDLRI